MGKTTRRESGFTLMELMITLVVASILVTVAIPSFRSMIQNNRATTQANLLLASINLARSEAVKRGSMVTICASTDGATCAGSAITDWATGWIVFSDLNGNNTIDDDGDATLCEAGQDNDCLLRVQESLKGTPGLDSALLGDIQYLSTGMTNIAAANETFTLTQPDCTGNQVRTITVLRTGRSSVSTGACP